MLLSSRSWSRVQNGQRLMMRSPVACQSWPWCLRMAAPHRVLVGVRGVLDRLQGLGLALARPVDDLVPAELVGGVEVAIEADDGGGTGRL